ncbi:MAG: RidA family protein [Comamonadaceae bacterium]|nr:MAG: RidA family protein [Comamonadaceae bacterium]
MNEAERAAGMPATPQYQYAQLVGNQLFMAGQVPHDSQGQLVGAGDSFVQAGQCLHNLSLVLSVHGFSMADVRQLVVYVAGEQEQLSAAWKATTEFFAGQVPPATLLGVARLGHPGQLVEVGATVVKA